MFHSVKCGIVFKNGETCYKCNTCALNPGMCLCEECFNNGNHSGHNYNRKSMGINSDGAFCDCGDEKAIRSGNVCCSIHRHESGSAFTYLN